MGWDGPVTQRQLLAWMRWMRRDWNNPDRTDSYLLQIACEVRRGYVKNPRSVNMEDFLIKMPDDERQAKPPPLSQEELAQQSKARWLGMMTADVKRTVVRPEEVEET